MGAFPTGVTVVTTLDADDNPVGLTCNAFASVSAEPPLVLVSLDRTSNTLPALRQRGRFVINFLAAGREEFACHKSQYSSVEMDSVNRYLAHAWNGTVWLRPWTGAMLDPKLFTR